MKNTDVLSQLKTLLGMEVKLEEMELSNGTVIEAEKFEKGQEVFIKTEDEKVALPEGIYDLADGKKLIVVEEGLIDEIKSETEEDMNNQENAVLEEEKDEKQEMQYATKEELGEVKEMVEEIKAMIEAEHTPDHNEEMSKEVVAEEVKAEQEELKEELSKPAAQAIKHSPEARAKRGGTNLYAQKRTMSTFDRVLNKISQINN